MYDNPIQSAVTADTLTTRFADRRDAGRALAELLRANYGGRGDDVLVLALPRGGVPVGLEVAAGSAPRWMSLSCADFRLQANRKSPWELWRAAVFVS